jgi:hypothetical protein
MKKTLTIVFLSISLSGFSQTEKGDWVITPTVGWDIYRESNVSEVSQARFNLPISIHKYLSDRFAVGLTTYFYHDKYERKPINVNEFYRKVIQTGIQLRPVVRYNILKTRFTPFIESDFFSIFNYGHISSYIDDPSINVTLREISDYNFQSSFSLSDIDLRVGISYFIKDRFALQLKLAGLSNNSFGFNAKAYVPINFGLQFIINNPRPEVESPR